MTVADEPAETRVVIIGGGLAGLLIARDTARPGFRVTLLEASDHFGGTVARRTVAGIPLDVGAESFASRGEAVTTLLADLHLTNQTVAPDPAGAWLHLPDRTVPLPKAGLLGIPSTPLAADVVRAIGMRAALRAWLDRVIPAWGIGRHRSLGHLVRRRMGSAVLASLVEPVAGGVYSADPDLLDIDVIAPSLGHALTRTGSLSSAVATLRANARAGSAVLGIDGGITRLVDALVDDARVRGAELRLGEPAVSIAPGERADAGAETAEEPAAWTVTTAAGARLAADAVVVATPGPRALELLAGASAPLDAARAMGWPDPSSVELITLVVDDAALDAAPRGTGVLVASSARATSGSAGRGVTAKALTHSTAKWPWLARLAGEHRHVIRLSYGAAGREPETAALDDAVAVALAVRDAATLLGVPLAASDVVDSARTRWVNGLPFAADGQRERLMAVRAGLEATPGIEAAGAWLAGTGIASVVPDARAAGERIRALRWSLLIQSGVVPTDTDVRAERTRPDRSESA